MRNKIDYFKELDALDIPWVESPFFYKLLENSNFTEEQKELAIHYHEKGYVVLDLDISDEDIETLKKELYEHEKEGTSNRQTNYEYTDSPRPFQFWKKSKVAKDIATNKKVLDTLEFLYNKKAFPFSTINFTQGSEQPLHMDSIHFHSIPQLWMVGAWIALEDVDEENGTLRVVPGSHKWGTYDYHNLKLPHPDERENGEVENYRDYEDFVRHLVKAKGGEEMKCVMKKGQILLWASNLLHGGIPIKDKKRTRLTQAIHYFFEGCDKYYHPMFSNPFKGEYAEKWCNEKNNILKEEKSK